MAEGLPNSKLVVVRVEPTPNPNAMKFVLNRSVSDATISARTMAEASAHPLVSILFSVNGVVGVMILHDFATINKSPDAAWADIKKGVRQNLQNAD